MEQTPLLPCPNICQDKAPLFPRVALLGDAPVGSPGVPAPRCAGRCLSCSPELGVRSKALLFVWEGAACFGLRVALRWGVVSPALDSYSPDISAPGPQHAFARARSLATKCTHVSFCPREALGKLAEQRHSGCHIHLANIVAFPLSLLPVPRLLLSGGA